MGRFLVHMHYGGDNCFGRLLALNESQSVFKELLHFFRLFIGEELRAGGDQGFHHPDAVLSGTAPGFCNLLFRFCPVGALGFHQMEVEPAAAGVNIRVAGVFCLGALVMGFNAPNLRSLVLGEAENGILRLVHY